jgi:hypothetical protein
MEIKSADVEIIELVMIWLFSLVVLCISPLS